MSTLTNEVGLPAMQLDPVRENANPPTFGATAVIDASGEKVALVGCVWHPTVKTGTINIRKIHFRCGAVTFNAASVLQVSLQNVSPTAGPPYQPDGSADQTVAMTTLTANVMNSTGNLSADRAVDLSADSLGDANSRWVAVVWEYTTFTVSDSVIISSNALARTLGRAMGSSMLLNVGSWAVLANSLGIIVLECDDGTFAFMQNCTPFVTFSSASVASNGAIRRAGVKFKFPTQRKIDRFGLFGAIPNGCDGTLTLYDSDGTTVLVSVDVDNDAQYEASGVTMMEACFEPVTLAADTFYRFVFVATTTTAATIHYGEVNAVGHMDGTYLGQNAYWTQHDGTSWSDTATTRRPWFEFGVSAYHDGAGGGMRLAGAGGLAAGG